jgi:hemin uptake protein HemP
MSAPEKLCLPARTPRTEARARPPAARRRLHSDSLFAGGVEVIILHDGQEYRLRRTRNGKLILNK